MLMPVRLSTWQTELAQKKHTNVAAVALAKMTVRIAWAMLRNGTDYDPELARAGWPIELERR